jgi:hypothetical protein
MPSCISPERNKAILTGIIQNIATQINKLKVHLDSLYKYKDISWLLELQIHEIILVC